MHKKLKIKGSILLSGNVAIMILTLATAVVLILSSNLFVLIYEIGMKSRVSELYGSRGVYIEFAVSFMLLFFCYSIYRRIKLGTDRFFLRRAQKKGGSARDIFYYFHPLRAADAMIFSLKLLFLRSALFTVALLPFALSCALLFTLIQSNVSLIVAVGLSSGCIAFFISGTVFYKNMSRSLFLSEYYYIDGKFVSFKNLISGSQEDMKKQIKTLRRLKYSFSGWFFLCLFILPIGYVWSYYKQTLAIAAATFMEN